MSKNVLLIAEVDEYLKGAAEAVFARNGMKTSTAISYYLHQVVVTQKVPALIVQPPNAMFDIREHDSQNSFSNPSLAKVRVVKKKDTPVICYDVENDREYLLDTDGQRYLDYARLKIDEYRYKTLTHLDGSGTIDINLKCPLIAVFERRSKNGYVSAMCEMPDMEWYDAQNFSDREIDTFTKILQEERREMCEFWDEKFRGMKANM